jgi:hypothetical protein
MQYNTIAKDIQRRNIGTHSLTALQPVSKVSYAGSVLFTLYI